MSTHAGTPSTAYGSTDLSAQPLCMLARVSPSHSVPVGALEPPPIAVRTMLRGDTMYVGWHPYRAGWDIQAGWGTRWLGDPESPMFVLSSM